MGQRQTERQVFRVCGRSAFEVRHGGQIVAHPIVGHAEQDQKTLVAGMLFQLGGEWLDGFLKAFGLEEREPKIHLKAGIGRIEGQCPPVPSDGLAVVLLARFEQTQMGEGLSISRPFFGNLLPGLFRFGELALAFQREGILARALRH